MKRIFITLMSPMLIVLAFGQANLKAGGEVRLSPRLLNYQGFLTDTLGNPITNPSVSMTFAIFDAASAGNQKWTETQSSVSVSKGIFHVLLGSVAAIPDSVFNNTGRWLELSVVGLTLTPRTRIVSVPFAYTATYSDTAQYARIAKADTDWIFSGNNIYSGVSGNVGIGTTTPNAKLSFGTNAVDNKIYLYDGASDKYGFGIRGAELMVYCGPSAHTAFGHYDGTTFTERMRMDNLGRVGIGTASPVERLDVNGGINFRRGDGDTIWRWTLFHNASSGAGDFGLSFWKNTPAMYLVLGNSSNNSYFPTGNVGIGTATPAVKFDVAGYARSTGSDDVGGGLSVFNSSKTGAIVNNWMIYNMTGAYGNALKFWRYYQNGTNAGPSLTLWDNGNAAFVGNVGIGQDFPNYKLDVVGATKITSTLALPALWVDVGVDTGSMSTGTTLNATNAGPGTLTCLYCNTGGTGTGDRRGIYSHVYTPNAATSTSSGILTNSENRGSGVTYGGNFWASAWGSGTKYGVYGYAGLGAGTNNNTYGVYGDAVNAGSGPAYGGYFHGHAYGTNTCYGGYFYAEGDSTGIKYGIYSAAVGPVTNRYAGYFAGNVNVTGSLTKGGGSFLIDHPLDPTNKTLRHNFVESPENLCLYRGKVKLNSSGEGKVTMPDYFKALTKETEATVTLTSIGRPFNTGYEWNPDYTVCTVYGEPDREVSYIVMADRDDPVMRQLYKPVEEEKGNGNFTKGKLLYPKAYGYSEEMGEDYERQKEAETHAEAGKYSK